MMAPRLRIHVNAVAHPKCLRAIAAALSSSVSSLSLRTAGATSSGSRPAGSRSGVACVSGCSSGSASTTVGVVSSAVGVGCVGSCGASTGATIVVTGSAVASSGSGGDVSASCGTPGSPTPTSTAVVAVGRPLPTTRRPTTRRPSAIPAATPDAARTMRPIATSSEGAPSPARQIASQSTSGAAVPIGPDSEVARASDTT